MGFGKRSEKFREWAEVQRGPVQTAPLAAAPSPPPPAAEGTSEEELLLRDLLLGQETFARN